MPFLQTLGGGSSKGFANRLAMKYHTQEFNYTGSVQTFTIPAGTQNITAHVFGPGGGADASYASVGGAGGYTVGQINPVVGGSFKIIVGGGGRPGQQSNGSAGGYSAVCTPNWAGSNVDTDHAACILVAGGGGGTSEAETQPNPFGGAGGGNTGQQGGYNNAARSGSGTGGTQSAGGVYPGSAGGGACSGGNSLCAGYKLRGGQSCGNSPGVSSGTQGWPQQIYGGNWGAAAGGGGCNGGGGGAGYYGGAGAGHDSSTYGNSQAGGGGSGYTGGSGSYTTSNVGTHNGNQGAVSSQATNSGYLSSGISAGGIHNTTNASSGHTHGGGHGKVVLYYFAPT